jgi:hypothetical protein
MMGFAAVGMGFAKSFIEVAETRDAAGGGGKSSRISLVDTGDWWTPERYNAGGAFAQSCPKNGSKTPCRQQGLHC